MAKFKGSSEGVDKNRSFQKDEQITETVEEKGWVGLDLTPEYGLEGHRAHLVGRAAGGRGAGDGGAGNLLCH